MKEALLYEKLENHAVHCFLCSHHCRINNHKFGICGVRENINGTLYTHVYRRIIAASADPVEKKPLYHFLPGTSSFSIATKGCNFRCGFCQNWQISQVEFRSGDEEAGKGSEVSEEEIVKTALDYKCASVSYTYTEPTIFFEYALETAKLAKQKGLKNIFVTNGYMTGQALKMILPYLDAANVDLKSFRDEFYRRNCKASLAPVLDTIRMMKELGIWVEITTLVIPQENDSRQELKDIAGFISGINRNIPWHVSKFHPDYQFSDYVSTPENILKEAQEIGRKAGLNYVYVGNVYKLGNDTFCHNCGEVLIEREILSVLDNRIKAGKCGNCGADIPGVFV